MEKKELGREDVIEALKEIAFGRVNRGVELTYLSEPTAQLIRKMDLSAVAEFKRNGNGTVEVKFVDRVKALSALYDMLGGGDADDGPAGTDSSLNSAYPIPSIPVIRRTNLLPPEATACRASQPPLSANQQARQRTGAPACGERRAGRDGRQDASDGQARELLRA